MYLGLRMCSLLILQIPHIPVEILLPNLLLPFIVQHGCMYICCTSRAWWIHHMHQGRGFFPVWANRRKIVQKGYVRKWLSVHICLWAASSVRDTRWMASLWKGRSSQETLVNTYVFVFLALSIVNSAATNSGSVQNPEE